MADLYSLFMHFLPKRGIIDSERGEIPMKLIFLGAAHEVTGSCMLLEAAGRRILIDCGMEQGKDIYQNAPLPVAPGELDAVLLTHAHIDHSGRLPELVKNGYAGKIYATGATAALWRRAPAIALACSSAAAA